MKLLLIKQKKHIKRRKKNQQKKQVSIHSYLPNKSLLEKIQKNQGYSQEIDEDTFNQLPMPIRSELMGAVLRRNEHKYVNQKRDIVRQIGGDKSGRSLPITVPETDKTNAVHDELLPTSNDIATFVSKETELLYNLGYNELAIIIKNQKWNMTCRKNLKQFMERVSSHIDDQGIGGLCVCSLILILCRRLEMLKCIVRCCQQLCNQNEKFAFAWREKVPFLVCCVQAMMVQHQGGRLRNIN